MFKVFKKIYTPTNEKDENGDRIYRVSLKQIGVVNSMTESNERYGRGKLLEKIV